MKTPEKLTSTEQFKALAWVGLDTIRHGPVLLDPFAVDIDALASVGKAAFDGTMLSLQLSLLNGPPKPDSESLACVLGAPFPMRVAHAGIDILVTFENIGEAPARLRGALLGTRLL